MQIVYRSTREMVHTLSPFFAREMQMLRALNWVYIMYRHTGQTVEVERHS